MAFRAFLDRKHTSSTRPSKSVLPARFAQPAGDQGTDQTIRTRKEPYRGSHDRLPFGKRTPNRTPS